MTAERSVFPATRPSVIVSIRHPDDRERRRARDFIARAYWRSVYKYLRLKWGKQPADAEDLTQAFFAKVYESDALVAYDRGRARFRTFVRLCVDRFVMKADEADRAKKRGGDWTRLAVDFSEAERELASERADVEAAFDHEWARSVIAMSIDELAAELERRRKAVYFEVFERYDLAEAPRHASYAEIALAMQISVNDVTNYLAAARREFRRILLSTLRKLTASDAEFRAEAKALIGIDPSA